MIGAGADTAGADAAAAGSPSTVTDGTSTVSPTTNEAITIRLITRARFIRSSRKPHRSCAVGRRNVRRPIQPVNITIRDGQPLIEETLSTSRSAFDGIRRRGNSLRSSLATEMWRSDDNRLVVPSGPIRQPI